MPEQNIRLSLGCGSKEEKGFVGLDIVDYGWNRKWDVKKDQIPFEDSTVTEIKMENFLEHVERKYWIILFNDCWRVLKPNGTLYFTAPDASKDMGIAMADPTHVSFFVPGTMAYLKGERPRNANYGLKPWIVLSQGHMDREPRVYEVVMKPNK